jgi:hypothetical protein
MALKQVKVKPLSEPILISKNALFTQSFDAEFILKITTVHLSCCEIILEKGVKGNNEQSLEL